VAENRIRSRCLPVLTRSTQKPFFELWNVTRSTRPAKTSVGLLRPGWLHHRGRMNVEIHTCYRDRGSPGYRRRPAVWERVGRARVRRPWLGRNRRRWAERVRNAAASPGNNRNAAERICRHMPRAAGAIDRRIHPSSPSSQTRHRSDPPSAAPRSAPRGVPVQEPNQAGIANDRRPQHRLDRGQRLGAGWSRSGSAPLAGAKPATVGLRRHADAVPVRARRACAQIAIDLIVSKFLKQCLDGMGNQRLFEDR
jgi:hypothetical protein